MNANFQKAHDPNPNKIQKAPSSPFHKFKFWLFIPTSLQNIKGVIRFPRANAQGKAPGLQAHKILLVFCVLLANSMVMGKILYP